MGTITISLDNDIKKELRETARKLHGSNKGAISKVIEDALKNYFSSLKRENKLFRAYKDDKLIAEAESLDKLAETLHKKGVDPRTVKIISSEPIKPIIKSGWR